MTSNSKIARRAIMKNLNSPIDACHWCGIKVIWSDLIKNYLHQVINDKIWIQSGLYYRATVDHVKELSKGGTNHLSNLVTSCEPCNSIRSNKPKIPNYRCKCGKFKSNPSKHRRCKICIDKQHNQWHNERQLKI